jgi:uncharacterized protein (DUF1919 family)
MIRIDWRLRNSVIHARHILSIGKANEKWEAGCEMLESEAVYVKQNDCC